MGFWTREKKDGQKTVGYGVFLAAGVLAIGLVVYTATKMRPVQSDLQASRAKRAVVSLGDTQRAATGMRPAMDEERPLTDAEMSSRGVEDARTPSDKAARSGPATLARTTGAVAVRASPSTGASTGGIESINVAMRIAEDAAKPRLDEGAGFFQGSDPNAARYQGLPRTVWPSNEPNPDGSRGGQTKSSSAMVVYAAHEDREVVAEREQSEALKEEEDARKYVVPRGEWISCYLLTSVESSSFDDTIIELGVAEPVFFNRRMQIPFGARIFATVNGKAVRMRMPLTADGIRYPNGLELPLRGSVKGEDRTAGVPAYYIAAPEWSQISPFVGTFLETWIAAEKQSARGTTTGGGLIGSLVGASNSKEFNPKAEASIAAATGLNDLIKARFKDVEERFGAHLVIPAGTKVWVQLTADANLAKAHISPRKPWSDPLPQSTQMASLARIAAEEAAAKNESRAASNAPPLVAPGSAIDRLIQAAASGTTNTEQAERYIPEKSTRSSVINKRAPADPTDTRDFFPPKDP